MTFIASDVMDGARALLNDIAAAMYTNTVLLPYVKMSNEDLEKTLIIHGVEVQRVVSAAITVLAAAIELLLPVDFLLPLTLKERNAGTTDPWVDIIESDWAPDNYTPSTVLGYWSFNNNKINFPGCINNREVLLRYERQLAVISGPTSPEDFILAKSFLERRTAELAARYVGMNESYANSLALREVEPSKDDIIRMLVLNDQGNPVRRKRFFTGR